MKIKYDQHSNRSSGSPSRRKTGSPSFYQKQIHIDSQLYQQTSGKKHDESRTKVSKEWPLQISFEKKLSEGSSYASKMSPKRQSLPPQNKRNSLTGSKRKLRRSSVKRRSPDMRSKQEIDDKIYASLSSRGTETKSRYSHTGSILRECARESIQQAKMKYLRKSGQLLITTPDSKSQKSLRAHEIDKQDGRRISIKLNQSLTSDKIELHLGKKVLENQDLKDSGVKIS